MMDKLWIIGTFGVLTGGAYLLSMGSVPLRGWLRVVERLCCGAALCWVFHLLLAPLGFSVPQSPFAALTTGYLGIPGAFLACFLASGV